MAKPKLIDHTGQRFGRLTVIRKDGNVVNGNAIWLCQCDCGNRTRTDGAKLRKGRTVSCGCFSIDQHTARLTTHGESGSRLYRIWAGMHSRCKETKGRNVKNYGARGIAVCAEWLQFEPFMEWAISNGYDKKLTIERKDNNLGYAPSNCTWATKTQQSRNRRFVRKNASGEAWSAIAITTGVGTAVMGNRVRRGWPIELAATVPKRLR